MNILLFGVSLLFFAALVAVAAVVPPRSRYSPFELKRRQAGADAADAREMEREAAYRDIVTLQRILQAVLLVGFVAVSIGLAGWVLGMFIAVAGSLVFGRLAAAAPVRRAAQSLYDRYEGDIIGFTQRAQGYLRWVRTVAPLQPVQPVASRDELRNIVSETGAVLSRDERERILAGLDFEAKQVRDIMTPRSVVDTIKQDEILGPLVLDDLHKTGHSRFPVIAQDLDHVVGVLYLRDILTLDTKRAHSAKVSAAMVPKVYYIREDHTLKRALAAFLKTHHHLFIVINQYRETVGILTLEDTMEALLGTRIVDEFDAHDDMRAVAERQASSQSAPNRPADSTDL